MTEIAIALGSNLDDRTANLKEAALLLASGGVGELRLSEFIETAPVGCELGTPNFLNAAAVGQWAGTPEALLELCQRIERELGRPAAHGVNTPRTVDLDIVLFGDLKMNTPQLTIPHPRAAQRDFVKIPLASIAPELAVKLGAPPPPDSL
ncbi:MAG: 2-amino-4-hydroxy-6-hydroxymethyldihydropteridine diphosphokinase [Victivallaceae bacterium]|nr:2-amino-4-hydroxy-6-hydroxymethyldihydropteridine diphosphokinase [Victivallaceae bacterium]